MANLLIEKFYEVKSQYFHWNQIWMIKLSSSMISFFFFFYFNFQAEVSAIKLAFLKKTLFSQKHLFLQALLLVRILFTNSEVFLIDASHSETDRSKSRISTFTSNPFAAYKLLTHVLHLGKIFAFFLDLEWFFYCFYFRMRTTQKKYLLDTKFQKQLIIYKVKDYYHVIFDFTRNQECSGSET